MDGAVSACAGRCLLESVLVFLCMFVLTALVATAFFSHWQFEGHCELVCNFAAL